MNSVNYLLIPTLLLCALMRSTMAQPVVPETKSSDILLQTSDGQLIPLEDLLGERVIGEILQRSQEQRDVPRYTIAQMELVGSIDRDVLTLEAELQIQVRAEAEWVTVPVAYGDVHVRKFSHSSEATDAQAVLAAGEGSSRKWHVIGKGLHSLKMELVGKTRSVLPGVSQLALDLPPATASHAVFSFSTPVELQKVPAGSVDKITSDTQGVRSIEFWGLTSAFAVSWVEVIPRVTQKPVIQVQNRIKLDLTTIPVNFTGALAVQIAGSPVSEIKVTFPEGFQLQEVDARNSAGVSVLNSYEITSAAGAPVTALIRLTSAIEGSLTLFCDLELINRQFPQDIRLTIPSIQDANVQTGDMDILFPTGLLVQQTRVEGAQRKRVTSETDLTVATTAFRMRSTESQVHLHVEETEAQFAVSPELTLEPDPQNVIMTAKYPVSVLKGSLLDLNISWTGHSSGDWQILPGSVRLISEKSNVPLTLRPSETDPDLLNLTFPERQSGEFTLEFRAFAPLAAVRSGAVHLRCPEIDSRRGQPFVITAIDSDEYSIRPVSTATGEVLSAVPMTTVQSGAADIKDRTSESWLLDDPAVAVRLELPTQAPSVQAEIEAGIQPRENGLEVRETISFSIEHRDLISLSLQVPDVIRPVVRISGQPEPLRATIEASNWSFRLPDARRGNLSIDVAYLWTPPGRSDGPLEVPLILPQSAEVRSIEVGTSMISGLRVASDSTWQPVYSEQFDSAWRTTRSVATIPLQWSGQLLAGAFSSPDLILVRTQILGRQVFTSAIAVYESVPDVISVETGHDLDVEAVFLGSQSLTSGSFGRTVMQTRNIPERTAIRWQIAAKKAHPEEFVFLEFRVREHLPDDVTPWRTTSFRRPVILGEGPAIPVIWCVSSLDEYQIASATPGFDVLGQQLSVSLPGFESSRQLADRQIRAIAAPFPPALQTQIVERVDDWFSQAGRHDVVLGATGTESFQVYLVPGVCLLLAAAVSCVVFFAVMSVLRGIRMMFPVLILICIALIAWLIWPSWTVMTAPWTALGVIFGILATMMQRLMASRRHQPPALSKAGEYPTVFGFSGMLSAAISNESISYSDAPRRAEYSASSAQ